MDKIGRKLQKNGKSDLVLSRSFRILMNNKNNQKVARGNKKELSVQDQLDKQLNYH